MTETTLTVIKEPEDKPGKLGNCGQPLPGVSAKVRLFLDSNRLFSLNNYYRITTQSVSLCKGESTTLRYVRRRIAKNDVSKQCNSFHNALGCVILR